MFQSFQETASPETGPIRLAALRDVLRHRDLEGFIVPRADAHQGEYVAAHDERLAWLTGFTGSAGFAVALRNRAAVFVDSRYRVQVKTQVSAEFEKIDWPETGLGDWIASATPEGGRIGFDPWLHSVEQHRVLSKTMGKATLVSVGNLVDEIWVDQPPAPMGKVFAQPLDLAGEPHGSKIERLAKDLRADACVITLPDSIAWLLNIRGSDIPRNPVPHGFAILYADATLSVYMHAAKLSEVRDGFGEHVRIHAPETLTEHLGQIAGTVQIDPATCPFALQQALSCKIVEAPDPCLLPKACKNAAELAGARAAHLRDAAAMVRFLAWLDKEAPGSLTEIAVVRRLEEERRATNALRDISFETISGSGPNGAIVHYRVTEKTDRALRAGELLLVDSGGQYVDGTTDITRTLAIGDPGPREAEAFTRVLRGMIALSRLRFPKGLAGRDIDPFARVALWEAGLDYGHGTGHGVGSYLSVHEGPARIARVGKVPLEPGMILSNEPGFYEEGSFGIRIENLIVVETAPPLPGQTVSQMLRFETLTWVPIDLTLVIPSLMTQAERDWLNGYHAEVLERVGPLVSEADREWLKTACRAI